MTNITPLKPGPSPAPATPDGSPNGGAPDGLTFAGILAVIGSTAASTAGNTPLDSTGTGTATSAGEGTPPVSPTATSSGTSLSFVRDQNSTPQGDASAMTPATTAMATTAAASPNGLTSTTAGASGTSGAAALAHAVVAELAPASQAQPAPDRSLSTALSPKVAALAEQAAGAGAVQMRLSAGVANTGTGPTSGPPTPGTETPAPGSAAASPGGQDLGALLTPPGPLPVQTGLGVSAGVLGPQNALPGAAVAAQDAPATTGLGAQAATVPVAPGTTTGLPEATTVVPSLAGGQALLSAAPGGNGPVGALDAHDTASLSNPATTPAGDKAISDAGTAGTTVLATPGKLPGQPGPSVAGVASAQQLLADSALTGKVAAPAGPSTTANGLAGLPLARPDATGPAATIGARTASGQPGDHGAGGRGEGGGEPGVSGGTGPEHLGQKTAPVSAASLIAPAAPAGMATTGLLSPSAPVGPGQHQATALVDASRPVTTAHLANLALPGAAPSSAPTANPPVSAPLTGPAVTPSGVVNGPAPGTAATVAGGTSHPQPPALPEQISAALLPASRQADGSYQVNIRLQPEELGVVHVELHLEAGTVNVSLHADGDATRDMLRQNLGQLRQHMAQSGLTTGHFDVGSGPGTGQGGTPGRPAKPELVERPGLGDVLNEATAPALGAAAPSLSTAGNSQLDMRL